MTKGIFLLFAVSKVPAGNSTGEVEPPEPVCEKILQYFATSCNKHSLIKASLISILLMRFWSVNLSFIVDFPLCKSKSLVNSNADKEISDLKEEIQLANSTLAVLGFFAIKEKKAKKLQIEQLNRDICKAKEKVKKDKEEVQKVIDSKKHRIVEIENEFIKDR